MTSASTHNPGSPNTAIRSVAFDLGGVVVDVEKGHLPALLGSGLRAACSSDAEVDAALAAGLFGDRHDRLSMGQLSGEDYVAEAAAALSTTQARVREAWRRVVRWAPGGVELLAAVAGVVPVRIWSNTDPLHWEVLGHDVDDLAARFSVDVAVSFKVGFMKPDPRYFTRALGGTDPATVLYVDDVPDNVAAAAACGIDAVVVRGVADARRVFVERGLLLV